MREYKRQETMNAHKVDILTRNRRAEEQRVKELLGYKNECQRLSMNPNSRRANAESPIDLEEEKRRNLELKRKEDALKKAEDERAEKEKMDQALEREILEMEIQRICESSEELRELERNINIAYVNKERAAQHQESLLIKKVESAREQFIEKEMEKERQDLIRHEAEKDKIRRDNLVAQKCVLQDQMRQNEVREYCNLSASLSSMMLFPNLFYL